MATLHSELQRSPLLRLASPAYRGHSIGTLNRRRLTVLPLLSVLPPTLGPSTVIPLLTPAFSPALTAISKATS